MTQNAIVLGVLFVLVFIAGFGIGRVTASNSFALPSQTNTTHNVPSNAATVEGNTSSSSAAGEEGTTVGANSLTDGQKKLLQAFGIDPSKVTITPQMIACAEAKLGVARVEEIKNGATPSFSEGASLVACYR